jgi:hypothetical protein
MASNSSDKDNSARAISADSSSLHNDDNGGSDDFQPSDTDKIDQLLSSANITNAVEFYNYFKNRNSNKQQKRENHQQQQQQQQAVLPSHTAPPVSYASSLSRLSPSSSSSTLSSKRSRKSNKNSSSMNLKEYATLMNQTAVAHSSPLSPQKFESKRHNQKNLSSTSLLYSNVAQVEQKVSGNESSGAFNQYSNFYLDKMSNSTISIPSHITFTSTSPVHFQSNTPFSPHQQLSVYSLKLPSSKSKQQQHQLSAAAAGPTTSSRKSQQQTTLAVASASSTLLQLPTASNSSISRSSSQSTISSSSLSNQVASIKQKARVQHTESIFNLYILDNEASTSSANTSASPPAQLSLMSSNQPNSECSFENNASPVIHSIASKINNNDSTTTGIDFSSKIEYEKPPEIEVDNPLISLSTLFLNSNLTSYYQKYKQNQQQSRKIQQQQQQQQYQKRPSSSIINLYYDRKKEEAINRIIRNERIKQIRIKIYENELLKEYQSLNPVVAEQEKCESSELDRPSSLSSYEATSDEYGYRPHASKLPYNRNESEDVVQAQSNENQRTLSFPANWRRQKPRVSAFDEYICNEDDEYERGGYADEEYENMESDYYNFNEADDIDNDENDDGCYIDEDDEEENVESGIEEEEEEEGVRVDISNKRLLQQQQQQQQQKHEPNSEEETKRLAHVERKRKQRQQIINNMTRTFDLFEESDNEYASSNETATTAKRAPRSSTTTRKTKPGYQLYQIGAGCSLDLGFLGLSQAQSQSTFHLKISIISAEVKNIVNVLKQVDICTNLSSLIYVMLHTCY